MPLVGSNGPLRLISSPRPARRGEPLLANDAFSNPDYVRFALKTTLAAFACYFFYTSVDWFGIHTAMVTCYFVALGSVGETIHKLTLRIVGCLIGATLGMATILFVMPYMTDIGHLALVVGAVCFLRRMDCARLRSHILHGLADCSRLLFVHAR